MAYIANIISKEVQPNGTTKVGVQFTDGTTTTPTEYIFPSDSRGLEFAIKGRLDALNFVAPAVGAYVPPVVTPPVLTSAEIDFNNFQKWTQLLIAIDAAKSLGVITGTEPVVVAAVNKVKALAVVNIPKMFL